MERIHGLIIKETESITHAESVLRLPFESNSMSWVLGHMAVYRDSLLSCTRQQVRLNAAELNLYVQGVAPITPENEVVPLERLLLVLVDGFNALSSWLHSDPDGLFEETPPGLELSFGATVVENFALLCWPDSYHDGQVAVLRELALSRQCD